MNIRRDIAILRINDRINRPIWFLAAFVAFDLGYKLACNLFGPTLLGNSVLATSIAAARLAIIVWAYTRVVKLIAAHHVEYILVSVFAFPILSLIAQVWSDFDGLPLSYSTSLLVCAFAFEPVVVILPLCWIRVYFAPISSRQR